MKSNKRDLNINFWSYPEETMHYLEKGAFNLEITNITHSQIEIKKITVILNTEEGLVQHKLNYKGPKISIKPKHIHPRFEIPFLADLSLSEQTNTSKLEIVYQKKGSDIIKNEFPTSHYLILRHRPVDQHFFVSHKDPEDTKIAQRLDKYLQKIGFKGFVAEIEKRPGANIWENKIYPGIDTCTALIVLWTDNARRNSRNILKEMKYATKKKKKIILIPQQGIKLPKSFPEYIEFEQISKFIDKNLIDVVKHIDFTNREGLYFEEDT